MKSKTREQKLGVALPRYPDLSALAVVPGAETITGVPKLVEVTTGEKPMSSLTAWLKSDAYKDALASENKITFVQA